MNANTANRLRRMLENDTKYPKLTRAERRAIWDAVRIIESIKEEKRQ